MELARLCMQQLSNSGPLSPAWQTSSPHNASRTAVSCMPHCRATHAAMNPLHGSTGQKVWCGADLWQMEPARHCMQRRRLKPRRPTSPGPHQAAPAHEQGKITPIPASSAGQVASSSSKKHDSLSVEWGGRQISLEN